MFYLTRLLFCAEVQAAWWRYRISTGAEFAPAYRWGSWARAGPGGREKPLPDWECPWLRGTGTYLPNEGMPPKPWNMDLQFSFPVSTFAMLSITSLCKFFTILFVLTLVCLSPLYHFSLSLTHTQTHFIMSFAFIGPLVVFLLAIFAACYECILLHWLII